MSQTRFVPSEIRVNVFAYPLFSFLLLPSNHLSPHSTLFLPSHRALSYPSFPLQCYFIYTRLIYYASAEQAEAAVVELNSSELNDRLLHLRVDREGQTDPEGASSMYVGNLPWQVTEEELESAFASYKPYYCRVMKNMSGRSRGFAILKFHSETDAVLAISSMNNFEIGGRAIEVRTSSRFEHRREIRFCTHNDFAHTWDPICRPIAVMTSAV